MPVLLVSVLRAGCLEDDCHRKKEGCLWMLFEVTGRPSRRYPDKLWMQVLILPYRKRDFSLLNGLAPVFIHILVLLEIINLQTGYLYQVGKECRCCWFCLCAGAWIRVELLSVIHGLVVNGVSKVVHENTVMI